MVAKKKKTTTSAATTAKKKKVSRFDRPCPKPNQYRYPATGFCRKIPEGAAVTDAERAPGTSAAVETLRVAVTDLGQRLDRIEAADAADAARPTRPAALNIALDKMLRQQAASRRAGARKRVGARARASGGKSMRRRRTAALVSPPSYLDR